MSKKKHDKLYRGLSNTFMAATAIMIAATLLATNLGTYVNQALGTSSVKAVSTGEDTDTVYYTSEFSSVTELVEAREAINEQVAEEGAALLRNENNALPLASDSKITLLGMASHQPMYDIAQGAAAIGNDDQIVSFEEAFADRGLQLNPTMIDFYEGLKDTYTPSYLGSYTGAGEVIIGEVPMEEYTSTQTDSFADYSDAAIIFIERNIGEGGDLPDSADAENLIGDGEHDALQLQNEERDLILMAKENFDKVIVLINSSNPVEIGELTSGDLAVDAIMWIGAVGCNGSYGIADLLVGNSNPSGGLVDTYATDNHSAPAMMNYGDFQFTNADEIDNENGENYIVEAEGVYVGYKYYETRYADVILGQGNADSTAGTYASEGGWSYADEVVYSFGYGLSYTTFSETLDSIEETEDGIRATVTVTNTGDVAGKDNVQLYMQSPYTDYDKENLVEKPFTFIGCAKTEELEPGASETLTIDVDQELLASYDYVNAQTYILEAGTYWFSIGNGSHEAVNNMLAAMGADGLTDCAGEAAEINESGALSMEVEETTLLNEGANGTEITNRLEDFSDLNSFQPGTVTYLSRSDWEATYPITYDNIEATGVSPNGVDMLAELQGDTYTVDTTQTIDFEYGNPDNTNYTAAMLIGNTDYDSEDYDLILNQMSLSDYANLAFPMMSSDSLANYTAGYNASFPGLTGNEGPSGNAVGFMTEEDHESTGTPYYMTEEEAADPYLANYNCSSMQQQSLLAATFSPDLAYRMGEIFGEDTLWTHCTAMEIGVNNHRTAYSGRNSEYYSECGNLSYIMGAAEAAGIESKGGYAMPKHFFGNDQETNRSGLATFANEAAMREIQLRGAEGAFVKAGARRFMTTFTRYGVIQSAYCSEAINDILRGEWGCPYSYNVTDMATTDLMYAARSVVNGTDTFCSFYWDGNMDYSSYFTEEAIAADAAMATALRESAHRALYLWANSNDANGYSASVEFVSVMPWWQTALIAVDVVFGVATAAFVVLYLLAERKNKKEVK